MEDANQTNNKLAWAILSKANGSQLSQVIKVTGIEADEQCKQTQINFINQNLSVWVEIPIEYAIFS